jgi:hypothetical protein
VQRQGYVLAIQDAFLISLIVTLFAIIASALVRVRRNRTAQVQTSSSTEPVRAEEEATHQEAMMGV